MKLAKEEQPPLFIIMMPDGSMYSGRGVTTISFYTLETHTHKSFFEGRSRDTPAWQITIEDDGLSTFATYYPPGEFELQDIGEFAEMLWEKNL